MARCRHTSMRSRQRPSRPIAGTLSRHGAHMRDARGLAIGTRAHRLAMAGRLPLCKFAGRAIAIGELQGWRVRRGGARLHRLRSAPCPASGGRLRCQPHPTNPGPRTTAWVQALSGACCCLPRFALLRLCGREAFFALRRPWERRCWLTACCARQDPGGPVIAPCLEAWPDSSGRQFPTRVGDLGLQRRDE